MSDHSSAATTTTTTVAAGASAPLPARWTPAEHLQRYDAFLFDCDGVLWQETRAIPGAAATLLRLQSAGKLLLFATNNSGKSREAYLEKFAQLGFDCDISPDRIFTSSQAAAHYLSSLSAFALQPSPSQPADADADGRKRVLTVGEAGIGHELRLRGIECVESMKKFGGEHLTRAQLADMEIDESIGAVVVGIDDKLTYTKVAYALAHLSRQHSADGGRGDSNRPCLFVSTNQDSTLPTAGHTLPGAGSCVAMLAAASRRTPINMGKPQTIMLDLAVEKFQLDKSRLLMVGDRLDTDIAFGINGAVDTLLVTDTGIHNLSDARASGVMPTYELGNVAQLLDSE